MIDYETMNMAELRAEFIRLGNELSVIDGERRRINAIIEKRTQEALSTNRVRAMTPAQRESLFRALAEFKG